MEDSGCVDSQTRMEITGLGRVIEEQTSHFTRTHVASAPLQAATQEGFNTVGQGEGSEWKGKERHAAQREGCESLMMPHIVPYNHHSPHTHTHTFTDE